MKFTAYLFYVVLAGMTGVLSVASAQTDTAINWINGSSLNALTELNAGRSFTTNFLGTNDVTVTETAGTAHSVYQDAFGGATPGNNPSYLTTFTGSSAANTGDGIAGHMKLLETAIAANAPTNTFQFDFSVPLNSNSRIVIADVDSNDPSHQEVYQVQAYKLVGGVYQTVSLAGWQHQAFTGQTTVVPNSSWATWEPSTGTLTSNSASPMNEPLDVLIPDQAIDRITFTKENQTLAGSAGIQIIEVPEPSGALLVLTAGVCVLLRRRQMSSI